LNDDPKAIFTAASKAQEAIEYLGAVAGEKLGWLEAASVPADQPAAIDGQASASLYEDVSK
jgi:antirestriction protein ArdC